MKLRHCDGSVKPNTACGAEKPATVHSPSCVNSRGRWAANSADADDRLAELRRDLLQPRREIDRRPDAGEIEPVAAADIAVQHLADVQRQPEADRVRRRRPAACRARRSARSRLARGGERPAADLVRVVAVRRQRENRQQSVADELQHLAAVLEDRRHLAVEIAVEQIDQLLRRQPLATAP